MKESLRFIISTIEMVVGTALTAAPFGLIIIPQGFVAAGVTGLAKVITDVLPIPLSVMVLAIELSLLGLGYLFIGKKFVAKSIAVSLLFPAMLEVFLRYPLTSIEQDPMLCTVVAGVMLGVGAGLVLHSGASSGGLDILAVVLNKKYKLPVATVMNICDALVIGLQAINQPLAHTFYGIIIITISAKIVGKVVTYGTGESRIMIFSEYHEEIRKAVYEQLDVGITFLQAESGYQQKPLKVIVSIVPYSKVTAMKRLITTIDPTAFVVVDEIHSVLGRGYTLDRYLNVENEKYRE